MERSIPPGFEATTGTVPIYRWPKTVQCWSIELKYRLQTHSICRDGRCAPGAAGTPPLRRRTDQDEKERNFAAGGPSAPRNRKKKFRTVARGNLLRYETSKQLEIIWDTESRMTGSVTKPLTELYSNQMWGNSINHGNQTMVFDLLAKLSRICDWKSAQGCRLFERAGHTWAYWCMKSIELVIATC